MTRPPADRAEGAEAVPFSTVAGIEWPAVATPAGASMLAMQWQLERSQWWPQEVLLARQFDQIRVLLTHAMANVPWYAEAARRAGLGSVTELTPATFRRWPILKKSDVRPNESSLRATRFPKEHGAIQETGTTGSTGTPLRVVHTLASQFFIHALVIREHLMHRREFSLKFGTLRREIEGERDQPGWGLVNAAFSTGPASGVFASTEADQLVDWLLRERPAYVLGYPTALRAMILRSRERALRPSGLLELLSFGEALPEDIRELARMHWGVPVTDSYSCTEVGGIACQCPDHEHYLVHAENVYVEILREDGTPCAPGEIGRVVLTPLHNFAMPLIRYDIGDYAMWGTPCSSGRGLPVLDRVAGRVRNMLRDPHGGVRWPTFSGLWRQVPVLRQARLVQRSLAEIDVEYVVDRDLTAEERQLLVSGLRERLGYPFDIRLSRVAQFERAAGGKFEEFQSLLPE